MKKILIILFIFIAGCNNETPIAPNNENINTLDKITLNSYSKTITLETDEQAILNDSTTTLNQFNDIKISSSSDIEVIGNYGDIDLILTDLSIKGNINWVNIVLINYNPYPVTIKVDLYKR